MSITVKSWPHTVKEPIDPGAVLGYGIDWTLWVPAGATIQTATWAITGGVEEGSQILHEIPDPDDPTGVATIPAEQTLVWLSVAAEAKTVRATVHIVLDTAPVALEDERTLILTVQDR